MSSSKVFKQDPHFVPTPLVRRSIPLPREEEPTVTETVLPEEPAGQDIPATGQGPELDREQEPEQAATPAPTPTPAPEPALAVDLAAIRQEAYNRGMADLSAQFELELRQAVAAFNAGCQKVDEQRAALFQRNRGQLVNLVILLCEKILRRELSTPRPVIAATLEAALDQAIESEEYTVTLHPDDLAAAEAKVPELVAAIRGLSRLVFKTDAGMTRGGCLLESSTCAVDASIELQLDSMREFLTEQPLFVSPPDHEPAMTSDPVVE
jgi:flagellar assembly protein FliH